MEGEAATQEARVSWHLPGESWKTGSSEKQARMEVYLEWLLVPKEKRDPRTKRALADRLGVGTRTLQNYAKDPWLQVELLKRQRTVHRVEGVGDVIVSLRDQALDPDNPRSVAAAKVYLGWVNQQVEPALEASLADMSLEELAEVATRLAESAVAE
jgi:hypothetical protein|tara:strand:- start:747 stop:1214 length:468 start_codon:yes stop_codon:yes gene_type:complete